MSELERTRQIQSQIMKNSYLGNNNKQLFAQFLEWHPNLYEGIDLLDNGAITTINSYFWEWYVNPKTFENEFLSKLKMYVGQYYDQKLIEVHKRVFDITTNERVRELVKKATDTLSRNKTLTGSRADGGTITDAGTNSQNINEQGSDSNTKNETINNKHADKELPMNSYGDDFDDIIDWSKGASNIREDNNSNNTTDNGTDSRTTATSGTDGNVRTLATTINKSDIEKLTDLANKQGTDEETYKEVNGQAVNLIENIIKYLRSDKAIHWLIQQLRDCFILVIDDI